MRWVGLAILVAGIVLQPVGWMFTHWLTAVSIVCIAVGVMLFIRGRTEEIERQRRDYSGGRDMPGDVYGNSGQMSGGRSTSWESHSAGEVGGGEGGGSD